MKDQAGEVRRPGQLADHPPGEGGIELVVPQHPDGGEYLGRVLRQRPPLAVIGLVELVVLIRFAEIEFDVRDVSGQSLPIGAKGLFCDGGPPAEHFREGRERPVPAPGVFGRGAVRGQEGPAGIDPGGDPRGLFVAHAG